MNRSVIISGLGVAQIIAWGSTYYLPAVLAEPIARDTGWPFTFIVGGLSLGLLVAAIISPFAGRGIDHHGGRRILSMSAIAIGLGQLCLALAPSLHVYMGAWLVIGLGMGAGLYNATFATLNQIYAKDARASITTLTLFGGFASTACWPLSAFLISTVGWRGACIVYAAINLLIVTPIYLCLIPRHPKKHSSEQTSATAQNNEGVLAKPQGTMLATLAITLTLAAAISSLLSVHLLTILQSGGIGLAAAVSLGALVGPAQVGARTIEMISARRQHHPIFTKAASVIFVAIGISFLWSGSPITPLALIFYGAGIGLESIARGTLPLALFGSSRYATLMGKLAAPSLVAQACAPWIGALLIENFHANGVLAVLWAAAMLNVALTLFLAMIISSRKQNF